MGMGRLPLALLAAVVLLAGCGGSDTTKDPTSLVPATGGLQEKVRAAQAVTAADFPAAGGRTLQQVANATGAAARSWGWRARCSRSAPNRVAFGDDRHATSGFVYGTTARLRRAQRRAQGRGAVSPRPPTCC